MVAGQEPWQVLTGLPAWPLTQVPRIPQQHGEGRSSDSAPGDGTAHRTSELVSAWCRSAPVAVAWVREQPGGPVRVVTAGPDLAVGGDTGQDVLVLPAGGRGLPL